MDFYDYLADSNRVDMLFRKDEQYPIFSTEENVIRAFDDIIDNKVKTLVYGDYDPDGAMSVQIIRELFTKFRFMNYDMYKYTNRTHSIDNAAVTKAITGGYGYMIICDAGSSSPEVVKRLNAFGVKVILLDHHQSRYEYEDFGPDCFMINTTFENRKSKEELSLSAGALTYLVVHKILERRGKREDKSLAGLALISLYADSIDMSDPLNRTIYYKAKELDHSNLPKLSQRFMTEYSKFNRRFIEYTMTPKLNSLFRAEKFDLLNSLLFWEEGDRPLYDIVSDIHTVYDFYRGEVLKASDVIEHKVMKNFVVGNLTSALGYVDIDEDKLYNYTGLVANKLAEKYHRTAIVYADTGSEVKGSLRDLYGRDYLSLFNTFCKAGGHNSAFGIHIPYLDFSKFMQYIHIIDENHSIQTVNNEPFIMMCNGGAPDTKVVEDMAIYNEFSGGKAPLALLNCIWKDERSPYKPSGGYYHHYYWGNKKIKSRNPLRLGSDVLIQPYFGYKTDMVVKEVR